MMLWYSVHDDIPCLYNVDTSVQYMSVARLTTCIVVFCTLRDKKNSREC